MDVFAHLRELRVRHSFRHSASKSSPETVVRSRVLIALHLLPIWYLSTLTTTMTALRVTSTSLSRKALTACRPRLYFGVRCTAVRPMLATRPANTYSTTAPRQSQAQSLAPKIERGAPKLFKDADAAVADIKSGSTILSSGFGLCGVAGWSFRSIFMNDQCSRVIK